MPGITDVTQPEEARTVRVVIDGLVGGASTRTFPHLLPDNKLAVADNVVFGQDGVVAKRPGNIKYGGNGVTGSSASALSMYRYYPATGSPQLIVQSGGKLFRGTDSNGTFTAAVTGVSSSTPGHYSAMYDPDFSTPDTCFFYCDGSSVPRVFNATTAGTVSTAAGFLPTNRAGTAPITPRFVQSWDFHLVYAGEPTEPTAVYISDALRPERFSGFTLTDSAGVNYIPYFPSGRDGNLGRITGLSIIGTNLIIFYQNGIIGGVNNGTYGAFQYQFYRISSSVGCVSPESIVAFDGYVIFYGGDKFYACDAQNVYPLPDEYPTFYGVQTLASGMPNIADRTTVVGCRRSNQYWASYRSTSSPGPQDTILVFDIAANGGWQPGASGYGSVAATGSGSGGAWSRWLGLNLSCSVECRGAGDSFQFFWGSSQSDQIAQHDMGTYSDFGNPISVEIRSKSFFLDQPANLKLVNHIYPVVAYVASSPSFTSSIQTYAFVNTNRFFSNQVTENVMVPGVTYGNSQYGTIRYADGSATLQDTLNSYPPTGGFNEGFSFAAGAIENSIYQFALIGFVLEVIVEPVSP